MSNDKLTIKAASGLEYLDIIVAFQLAMAYETEKLKLDKNVLNSGVKAVLENPNKGIYYIALDNTRPVGMMLTMPEWSDWRNREVIWIHSVYVTPELRGKGIFKQLYNHLKAKVSADPNLAGLRLYVEKTNLSAQKVYQKLGMSDEHYHLYEWLK